MMTSPLLYKLTSLAGWCQCWPLVRDQDIVCLCLWSQPSSGQSPVIGAAARRRKPQCTPSLASLPRARLAIKWEERGQRGGIYWLYFTRGGVGIFPCPFRRHRSWPRPKARANLLFICCGFFVPVCLCCVYNCGPADGVSPRKRGRFPRAGSMAPPEADGSFPL